MTDPFPVLRRFSAASPNVLAGLPKGLGAHPFAPMVEGHPDQLLARHAPSPVALDPGTDLAEWATLVFHDDHGPVAVTTTGMADSRTMPLQTFRDFSERWAEPRPVDEVGEVTVKERLIRRVGRGGALVDAALAGGDPDPEDLVVVYSDADVVGFVVDEVTRLGPTAFADRYGVPLDTAKSWASGRHVPSSALARGLVSRLPTIVGAERVCALDGCDAPVLGPNASYCCKAHRDGAHRLRKKSRATTPVPPRRRPRRQPEPDVFTELACRTCGTVLLGAAVIGSCPVCPATGDRE